MNGINKDEERRFLQLIKAEPENDKLRLKFGHWLQERGDPRGDFIGWDVTAARWPESTPRSDMEENARELRNAYRNKWEAPLRQCGVTRVTYDRGLPTVEMTAEKFLEHGEKMFAENPWIAGLWVRGLGPDRVREFASSKALEHLTRLDLRLSNIGAAGADALADSPYLKNLIQLELGHNAIGPTGACALAASPYLKKLSYLGLSNNHIGDGGALALAGPSSQLQRLTRVDLLFNEIGDDGALALAASPNFKQLARLDLSKNNINVAGAKALAKSPHFPSLTHLELVNNDCGSTLAGKIKRDIARRAQAAGMSR